MDDQHAQRREIFRNLFGIVRFIATVVFLVWFINAFGFQSYEVYGKSMEPTLHQGDRLLISKFGKTASRVVQSDFTPERGEIIVFKSPKQDSLQLIKRVIGLPGDRVVVRDGEITLFNDEHPDGIAASEYIGDDFGYTNGSVDISVREDHLFVVGDNRNPSASLDSRNDLGTVPTENVQGELVLRIFPLNDVEWF